MEGLSLKIFSACHPNRKPNGRFEIAGVRLAMPSDVEGGSMIDRSADDGEAQSDIHGRFESDCLDWNQSLVVIHTDVGIGYIPLRLGEGGVGRDRAYEVATFLPHSIHRRLYNKFFFAVSE